MLDLESGGPGSIPGRGKCDLDFFSFPITNLSNLGSTDRVDQYKKEEEENGCVQAVHSFIIVS